MLRDRRLVKPDGDDDVAHLAFTAGQKGENLTATWLGDGVKGIGGGSSSSHGRNNTFLYRNMSRGKFKVRERERQGAREQGNEGTGNEGSGTEEQIGAGCRQPLAKPVDAQIASFGLLFASYNPS
jgi:hypothetical protein